MPDQSFKDMLLEAITDELNAVSMYATMATMVTNPTLQAIILSVAGDEYQHAKIWMTMHDLAD